MGKGSGVKSQYLDTSDKHNSFAKVKVNCLVPSALWSMAKGLGPVIMLNGQIGYRTHDVILACVAHKCYKYSKKYSYDGNGTTEILETFDFYYCIKYCNYI